ncbi:MAG: hypothetical protein JXQ26_11100 [Tissierellales bacterium]|nr:hypothetical protein [Tissierellales bacterium]
MSRSICISIFKDKFHISYEINNVIISKDCEHFFNIKEIKKNILSFLTKNEINKDKIDNIIVSTDFTKMDKYFKKTKRDVIYLQISPYHKDEWKYSNIFSKLGIKIHPYNIGLPKEKDYLIKTAEIIKKTANLSCDTILINSIFSGMYKKKEEELVENLNNIFKGYKLVFSNEYNSNNYVLRENALILDYYYSHFSKQFYDELYKALKDLKINTNYYGLKSDGYLTTLKNLINYPILTKDSYYTNKIISYSKYFGKETFSLILKENDNIKYISMKKGNIEKNREFSSLDFLKIPPYLINVSKYNDNMEMLKNKDVKKEEFIINVNNENIAKKINSINIIDNENILNLGISKSNFLLELNSTIFDSNEDKINNEMKSMRAKAEENIVNNNIVLSNIEHDYKINSLKYMLHNSCFLELRLSGEV